MVILVEVGCIVVAVIEHDEDAVAVLELAEEVAVAVEVEAKDVAVEPHLASAERRAAVRLQPHLRHLQTSQQVAHAAATLDGDVGKVLVHELFLQTGVGFKRHLDDFSFAVGVGGEIDHATARFALRQVVLLVAQQACGGKALDVERAALAVAINHVVDGALVVFLEQSHPEHTRADEHLLRHLDNLVPAVLVEEDDVVDV